MAGLAHLLDVAGVADDDRAAADKELTRLAERLRHVRAAHHRTRTLDGPARQQLAEVEKAADRLVKALDGLNGYAEFDLLILGELKVWQDGFTAEPDRPAILKKEEEKEEAEAEPEPEPAPPADQEGETSSAVEGVGTSRAHVAAIRDAAAAARKVSGGRPSESGRDNAIRLCAHFWDRFAQKPVSSYENGPFVEFAEQAMLATGILNDDETEHRTALAGRIKRVLRNRPRRNKTPPK